MKTYYEKHSLEYDAKVRCFFISCNICTEIFCKYSTKLIFVNTFCLLRHIMDVKEKSKDIAAKQRKVKTDLC